MTVTPTERGGLEPLESEVLSQLAELRAPARPPRARLLPGVPPLRSVALASALVLASAVVIVGFSLLSPATTEGSGEAQTSPAPRPTPASPAPTAAVAAAGREPLPAFVWVPVRGATGYEFRLLRDGTTVYTAHTASPRLTLPRRWVANGRERRVEPGTYLWDVRPLFGKRRGKIVVQARLDVAG